MTRSLEDLERIVKTKYPQAFAFGQSGAWSICNGTRTSLGNIRIPRVGWYGTIGAAWKWAAKVVENQK